MARYRYGTAIAEETPAGGVTGFLNRRIGGRYFFRVYGMGGEFTDYDLVHDDLEVTIHPDAMASFYAVGENKCLDHSSAVLGLRNAED